MNWLPIASVAIGVIGILLFLAFAIADFRRWRSARRAGLRSLIGKRVAIIFHGPSSDWPIEGFPAWAYIMAIDEGFALMGVTPTSTKWVSLSTIRTIRE